ncbi:MAG: CHAT domain-containing protein [Planctomycetes bacterium]|nr:CHAT domain-containing protein [Planctomycetota bacterium]
MTGLAPLELLRLGERLAEEDRDLQARLAFERARAGFAAGGDRLRALYALVRQATAELALRDLAAARAHHEAALAEVARLSGGVEAALPEDGSPPGAAAFLEPDDLDRRAPHLLRYLEAAALCDLGLLASIEGRLPDAARLLEQAAASFEALGCEREEGDAHRFLAITRVKGDEPGLAALEFQRAEACYARVGDVLRRALARAQSNKLYFDRGLFAEAVAVLDEALVELERRGLPSYWLRYHRAMNLEGLGRGDDALAELERAFEDLATASRHVTAPGVRARFLEGKEGIPATLIARAWAAGADELVHRTLQRAKTSGFAELLGSRDLLARALDADGPAARAYLDARRRLREVDALLATGDDPAAARARREVLAEVERLEASLDTRDAALVGPRPLTLEALQAALPRGAVLLDYVLHRDGLGVVVVSREGRRLVALGGAGRGREAPARFVEEAAARVEDLTLAARAALEAGDVEHAVHLYEGLGLLDELHDVLLGAPEVQAAVADAQELVVVPHRQLFRVPWHLLRRDGRYLLERLPVSVLPTVAALRGGGPLRLERTGRVLFLVTGSDEARARLALAEVGAALPRFRNVCLVTGGEASRRRLEAEVGHYDVIHFAGHAAYEEEFPGLSHLALGAGRADPAWERLTVRDVLQLRLRPCLVVLSGCQTARASASRGEELIGLAHAFLVAGARAVIGTYWPFEPPVAQALLPGLYDGLLAGLSPPHALRAAQLALLRSSGPLRCPYAWGAFSVTSTSG